MSRTAFLKPPHSKPALGPYPRGLQECGEQTRPPYQLTTQMFLNSWTLMDCS